MRKIIVSEMVSVDGLFERPNGDLDWHVVDDEFNEFAIAQLNAMDAILFGRVNYLGMASYWPTQQAINNDPVVAGKMNSLPKIVFSKTLKKAEWSNSRLVAGDLGEEVSKLKQQPGKDMVIFGSAVLVSAL